MSGSRSTIWFTSFSLRDSHLKKASCVSTSLICSGDSMPSTYWGHACFGFPSSPRWLKSLKIFSRDSGSISAPYKNQGCVFFPRYEAKMLYCITDTVRRTSFWTPSNALAMSCSCWACC
eukprot:Skav222187  [mRNA]  locus=scaffold3784:126063:130699:+ [translate_table: standard]